MTWEQTRTPNLATHFLVVSVFIFDKQKYPGWQLKSRIDLEGIQKLRIIFILRYF